MSSDVKKIVVLFGSFNPLTNAHMEAMRSGMAAVQADQGLFIATNGTYLRSKTLKRNDNFYLSEEERKEAITRACETEENMSFWGYEQGGAAPKRYRTLARVAKKNPGAIIYEIEGADKLQSLVKSPDVVDYLNNIKFIFIGRNDIDVQAVIDEQPLLKEHQDSFMFLPGVSDLSSSEVRRLYYAEESFDELVPEGSAEIIKRHKPQDFVFTFEERMEHLVRHGGRFGGVKAMKEVYRENGGIFESWQNGADTEIDMGNYLEFMDATKLYSQEFNVSNLGTVYPSTETYCANIDCVDMAADLVSRGYKPAILNLASAVCPGGGYHKGSSAQEESLCRSSNLSLSLYQFGSPKYKFIRDSGVAHRCDGYPLDLNYGGIYTPDVTFFRHGKSKYFALRDKTFKCGVITVSALSFNNNHQYSDNAEHCFKADNGLFTPEGEEVMLNKIRTIFRLGVENGNDSLVLGAFGCGVFKLPVNEVVRQFRIVMEEDEFKNKFRVIVFAIMESIRRPNGMNRNYAGFYQEFGEEEEKKCF